MKFQLGIRSPLLLGAALTLACSSGTEHESVPENAASAVKLPEALMGHGVIVTFTANSSSQVRVGEKVVYRYISRSQIVGANVDKEYASSSWEWTKISHDQGTMRIVYQDRKSFEEYQLKFADQHSGTCEYRSQAYFVGPAPEAAAGKDYIEHHGECTFEIDQTCVQVADPADCDQAPACSWNTKDANPVCVPEPSDVGGLGGIPHTIKCPFTDGDIEPSSPSEIAPQETPITLPRGSTDCVKIYREYADAAGCNNIGALVTLDDKYWACRVCDREDCSSPP